MKYYLIIFLFFYTTNTFSQQLYDTSIRPADYTISAYLPFLKHKNVALIINQSSVINKVNLLDLLIENKINITKIFEPEHGFRGNEDAGATIENNIDSQTKIPIISLYGKHNKPLPDDLKDIDVMVYDLQDVGVRFYTYISTLQYCMEACAENKIQLIILDRPNPNGFYIDGPVLEKESKSFVGMQPIPVVYGMTCGEYAQMLKGENWFEHAQQLNLKVILCNNYTHSKRYKLPIPPSPNLKTMAAIYAYPSLCFFEGTVISVGRGTECPFQQFGCPEFSGINKNYSYKFTPKSNFGAKHPLYENKDCVGELIGISENDVLDKINNHIDFTWLINAYRCYPDKDKFFNNFFEKLSGNKTLKTYIKQGYSNQNIHDAYIKEISDFKEIRKKYLLYEDFY